MQEGETLEREMCDINKDNREQGCGPEGHAHEFEVYYKGKKNQ